MAADYRLSGASAAIHLDRERPGGWTYRFNAQIDRPNWQYPAYLRQDENGLMTASGAVSPAFRRRIAEPIGDLAAMLRSFGAEVEALTGRPVIAAHVTRPDRFGFWLGHVCRGGTGGYATLYAGTDHAPELEVWPVEPACPCRPPDLAPLAPPLRPGRPGRLRGPARRVGRPLMRGANPRRTP